jgi:manganese-transporting P-type ATPase
MTTIVQVDESKYSS